jgi:hypothetical protein
MPTVAALAMAGMVHQMPLDHAPHHLEQPG